MSDTDSFIEEVTEEVRRDRLFQQFRRYGWIAVVVVVGIVGAAAWNEYQKAQDVAAAQKLGDDLMAALQADTAGARAGELTAISAGTTGGRAITDFALAAAQADAGQPGAAAATLESIATNGDLPQIYRRSRRRRCRREQ